MKRKKTKPCRYCGHEVAKNTKRCPACGGKWPHPANASSASGCALLTVLIFAGIVAIAVMGPSSNKEEGSPIPEETINRSNTAAAPSVSTNEEFEAIEVVRSSIDPNNKLGVGTSNVLKTMMNPKGEGFIVFAEQTQYTELQAERFLVWLVVNDTAYPCNGATMNICSGLSWYDEAEPSIWETAGWGQYERGIIDLVFGEAKP